MTVVVTHSTPADGTFSATGATAWDANHTLSGVGTMAEQNANAVAITGGTATLTSVTTPTVQATNSAGLALKNSAGTTQISMGAGGGDNISLNSSTNINGTNAQIDISPTGTGHVHIKPTGVNSVEIAPTYVGEMDNIVIGAVTPKAGTFTTITGQTGVLRGTGQNFLLQSQDFTTSWTNTATTDTANSTTAPDGTATADTITETTASSSHNIFQAFTPTSGLSYVFSVFVKKGNGASARNFVQLGLPNTQFGSNSYANFDIVNGTVTVTGAGLTSASIVSAGNNWFRCIITDLAIASTSANAIISLITTDTAANQESYTGTTDANIFLWGAQVEVGSTANTYIPTTTTAIYGTPTLSFSGVSTLGLESNGALFLQPAGTGAIQAQATTSSTVGGNARGANAVDWQTSRTGGTQVASGINSVVGGGGSNSATTTYSAVFSGLANTASNLVSVVAGGQSNVSSGYLSFVGGGISNTAGARDNSTVVGGQSNTAGGFYNFIGGGFTNSGTSASAVTTQSGTMNATTAVTLSGSNANIKVGQLITGTSIASYTYVAAISGTALTLSVAASGSSTSTLSFYTPHGVVVGGGNNQATGSYSFIGGGGDAGTATNRNVASGDWSVVGGGSKNLASGIGSFVGGGGTDGTTVGTNTASGTASTVGGGLSNTASGTGASVLGGYNNLANNAFATAVGGRLGTVRSIVGNVVFAPSNAPLGGTSGVCQTALLTLAVQTTDATATALRSDSGAAGSANQVILPNNSAYFFTGEVVSGVTGGGNTKGWTIEGVIKRGANAASTALVGTPTVVSTYADVGAATWVIAVTADTTNGGIRVTFTGQAATTIRTVAKISSTEMTY